MIRFKIVDWGRRHYIITSDEPITVESSEDIVFVYRGAVIDLEREPVGCIDFTIPEEKHSTWWEVS